MLWYMNVVATVIDVWMFGRKRWQVTSKGCFCQFALIWNYMIC